MEEGDDVKLLHEYLIKLANSCILSLEENNEDKTAYMKLLETVYCRTILLNRKRSGELASMPLLLYDLSKQNKQNDQEFENIVSPTEQILLNRFKRIVIRGKRGRDVSVLFSNDVQKHIDVLLKYRHNFISKTNTCFFAKAGFETAICGYEVLETHVKVSGVKNGQAITATRLRKHLATITQIFNLSSNELEQLATFMGHTEDVYNEAYRLPDDVFQTAKVSKLLLLMEAGQAANYKEKSLEEIDIEEELEGESDSDTDVQLQNVLYENICLVNQPSSSIQPCIEQKKKLKESSYLGHLVKKLLHKNILRNIFQRKKPRKRENAKI